jgi:cystathionine beta-lyase family protein involved in aluminum resistance
LFPYYTFPPELLRIAEDAQTQVRKQFSEIEARQEYNQQKVLAAFQQHGVQESHFAETTGYGYGDRGRETLEAVFATCVGAEDALYRHSFVSGTHALTVALFGLLRPGDVLLCVTGRPYDTLHTTLGLRGAGLGSLQDFGVHYNEVELRSDGSPDLAQIETAVRRERPKVVYLQRSRGYTLRPALRCAQIREVAEIVKRHSDAWVVVDDCYGEFTETTEPTQHGADLIVGSLIKNPGGGCALNGGYIAGRQAAVTLCAQRLTAPGLGREVGASLGQNRNLFMGLFHSPHVVGEALKTAVFAAALFRKMGFAVTPAPEDVRGDIVQTIVLGTREKQIAFCRGLQSGAPIDAQLLPEPAPMPGYDDPVIMSSGSFIFGSSIELSADAPIRSPYAVWLQGGLNFHSGKIGVLCAAKNVWEAEKTI